MHANIDELSALADRYRVSLTAAAIRFTAFTSDPCAVIGVRPPEKPWISKGKRTGWWIRLPPESETLISDQLSGVANHGSAQIPAELWIEKFSWRGDWTLTEEVIQTSAESWLVLLSELPDPDDDPDLVDREAEEELERRRMSFRRY